MRPTDIKAEAGLLSIGRRWGAKAAFSVADQGIVSGANFALNILLARWLTPAEYGAFAVAFTIFLFLSGFHNALVLEPMCVLGPSQYRGEPQRYRRSLLLLNLGLTGGLAAVAVLAALIVKDDLLGKALWGLAAVIPFTLLFWFLRRVCYLDFRPEEAARSSLVYAVLLIASTFAFQWNGQLSLFQAFLCMGTAGLGASIPGLRTLYLEMLQDRNRDSTSADHSRMPRVFKEHWNYGKWVAALTVLSLATLHIQTLLSAALLGLEAAGALRAVTNFILPAMQTINSISMLGLPVLSDHFGRGDMKGLLRKSFFITTGLTVLGCACEVPLLLFNGQLEGLVYGGKFAAFSELIPVMGLIPVFSGLASGYSLALRAVQKPQHYVIVGAITAPIGIVTAILFTNLWGLGGLAAGMVITYASGTAVTFFLYRTWVLPQRVS